jgi:hypothetical protein
LFVLAEQLLVLLTGAQTVVHKTLYRVDPDLIELEIVVVEILGFQVHEELAGLSDDVEITHVVLVGLAEEVLELAVAVVAERLQELEGQKQDFVDLHDIVFTLLD